MELGRNNDFSERRNFWPSFESPKTPASRPGCSGMVTTKHSVLVGRFVCSKVGFVQVCGCCLVVGLGRGPQLENQLRTWPEIGVHRVFQSIVQRSGVQSRHSGPPQFELRYSLSFSAVFVCLFFSHERRRHVGGVPRSSMKGRKHNMLMGKETQEPNPESPKSNRTTTPKNTNQATTSSPSKLVVFPLY